MGRKCVDLVEQDLVTRSQELFSNSKEAEATVIEEFNSTLVRFGKCTMLHPFL